MSENIIQENDNEIKEIEASIKNVDPIVENENIDSEIITEVVRNPDNNIVKKFNKLPRKKQIIQSLKMMSKKLGLPIDSDRDLNRAKLGNLEKKLAEMSKKTYDKIVETQLEKVEVEMKSEISDELAVKALFNVNILVAKTLEDVTKVMQGNENMKNYCPDLEGYTKELFAQEKELKECLKLVIEQHGKEIKPWVSPLTMYAMIMIGTAGKTIANNMSKNLEQQSQNTNSITS